MKFIAKAVVRASVAGSLICAAAAHAEGLYVGAGIGSSRYNGNDIGGLSTDHSATGLKLYGGYAITPNIGVEAGWADLGKFKGAAGDLKARGVYVDAVGTMPLADKFSALARVGVFNGKLDSSAAGSDSATRLKFGAGVQYAIDKNLAVRGEWERYKFDALGARPHADLYSVGVNYGF